MTTAISSDIYAEHAAEETGSGYRMTYNFGNTPKRRQHWHTTHNTGLSGG